LAVTAGRSCKWKCAIKTFTQGDGYECLRNFWLWLLAMWLVLGGADKRNRAGERGTEASLPSSVCPLSSVELNQTLEM